MRKGPVFNGDLGYWSASWRTMARPMPWGWWLVNKVKGDGMECGAVTLFAPVTTPTLLYDIMDAGDCEV